MERRQYVQTLGEHAAVLIDAARTVSPDAPVPGCPDWSVSDLVWHVARIHDVFAYVVREEAVVLDGYAQPTRPSDDAAGGLGALADFAVERAAELQRVLAGADPDQRVGTWAGEQTVAWVMRRVAHETAVHRFDAERAAGREFRLDAPLAADGIDEFLTSYLIRTLADTGPLDGTVHLHCTDAEGEWTIAPAADGGGHVVTREHAKGDVAMRGEAHDLLMVLWRRVSLDAVTVFGDPDLAARIGGDSTDGAAGV